MTRGADVGHASPMDVLVVANFGLIGLMILGAPFVGKALIRLYRDMKDDRDRILKELKLYERQRMQDQADRRECAEERARCQAQLEGTQKALEASEDRLAQLTAIIDERLPAKPAPKPRTRKRAPAKPKA